VKPATTDEHGRTIVEPDGSGVGRDFYVTVIDGPRTGYLLGPYKTHGEALANVRRGELLTLRHDTKALFGGYGYGTCSAPHGTLIKPVFALNEEV
jgi:hypothetical protein